MDMIYILFRSLYVTIVTTATSLSVMIGPMLFLDFVRPRRGTDFDTLTGVVMSVSILVGVFVIFYVYDRLMAHDGPRPPDNRPRKTIKGGANIAPSSF